MTGSQSHILAGFHHALVVQVSLGVHGHIAAFGFHIAFVGDAATSGDHGHRRTCCHGLIVDHGLTGSQFHTLATRHGTLVTQVSLGVHGHVPVLGFHIGLVGDAASIGFQVHTLAARHGTLVLQVRLGVHGHVAVFGFHIAFIDDAAASGGHGHSGTCPHDALVEDFIGRRQFHLVGSDQALVDHALGGVQDDVVPGQAVFILQGPGCLFMEPAAANGEGSRSLQISLVIDQADASRSRHRSVDGQVVHRTVLVIANGDILCLAVSVKENGQVFAAAAADDHIGGIAAVLHGHGLEVVELRVICKSGTTVERNARSRINRNRLCRDGMGRRLLDGATCLEVQRIGSECAVLQVDFPVTGQIHRICLHLAHKHRRFFIIPKAQAGFSRHSNRMARTRFHRAKQEKTVLFPGLALAGQVNIAIFRFGIDGRAIPQDAYTAVLRTNAAFCLQVKQPAGIEVSLCRCVRTHGDILLGGQHHILAGIEPGKLQIVIAHTADIHAAVCQSRQAARQVDVNWLARRPDVSTTAFENQILSVQVGTAIRQGVGHAGFAQNADITSAGRYLAQFQDSILVLAEGTAGHIDIAVGLDIQFTFGFDAHRHLAVDTEYIFTLVILGIAHIGNIGVDNLLQIVEPFIRGNTFDQNIFGRFVRANVLRVERDILTGDVGLLELCIRAALLLIDDGIADGIEQFIFSPAGTSLLQISQMILGCVAFSQVVVSTRIIAIAVFQGLIIDVIFSCFFLVCISSLQF